MRKFITTAATVLAATLMTSLQFQPQENLTKDLSSYSISPMPMQISIAPSAQALSQLADK